MNNEFTAEIAQFTKGTKYTGGSGPFDEGALAEKVLPHLKGGSLFAYLFRRFGYPSIGWDGDKELVTYCITTPMKDLFLGITPYCGGDFPHSTYDCTELMFSVYYPASLEKQYSDTDDSEWEKHPLSLQGVEAICRALHDLLRPVFIRDVPINCYGRVEEEEEDTVVGASPMAGWAIPEDFFTDTVRWEQFYDALSVIGKGSIAHGMQAIITLSNKKGEDLC